MKYLKLFNTHSEYEAYTASTEFIKPNVSHCIQENEVHYNPYVPPTSMNIITYTATAKLSETTNGTISGLHTDRFGGLIDGQMSQLTIVSHTFKNGVGTIEFDGDILAIDIYAFLGAWITSITIPESVTYIGNYAFYECTGLTSIISLATTAPTIQSNTFQSVKTGGTLYAPQGSSGYGAWMGNGNYYLGKYNWTKVEQ